MQEDLVDAVKWAIEKGIADADRVVTVGTQFGGYGVLDALARAPDLFRCGVALDPIADWHEMWRASDRGRSLSFATFKALPRDLDEKQLREISPVNYDDRITRPLLLSIDAGERVVGNRSAQRLAAALKKAGRPPQILSYDTSRPTFSPERYRAEALEAAAVFFAKHLGDTSAATEK